MIKTINSNLQSKTNNAACPVCCSELNVPFDTEKGQILSCPDCGIELEVKEIENGGDCESFKSLLLKAKIGANK